MLILLFDIDGTLINTGGAGGAALRQAFQVEFAIDRPGQVQFSGRTDRGIVRNLFQLHDIPDTQENWLRVRDGYLQRLPEHLPQCNGRVLPGVEELLMRCSSAADTAVGLLTGNIRAGAQIKLEHFDLYNYFSFGGFGDDHYERDNVARAALAAAKSSTPASTNGATIWVIGDTPLDVSCARAIGANVLAVATGLHPRAELEEAEPDVLLDDLSDTEKVLEQVARS